MASSIRNNIEDESSSDSDNEIVHRFMFPQHDLYVSEWLLSHKGADITNLNVWQNINTLVKQHWGEDYGPRFWRWRWVNILDKTLGKEHGLHISLPVIDEADPFEIKLEKANIRLAEFQQAYELVSAPLSLMFLTCAGKDVCLQGRPCDCKEHVYAKCDQALVKFVKQDAQDGHLTHMTSQPISEHLPPAVEIGLQGIQEKVFDGLEFYLPHSSNVLKEIDRWKVEILIWLHGGTCNPKEADAISRKAIVLATGDDDEDGNLCKIRRWYQCKLYEPSVIEKAIESGKRLDKATLDKYESGFSYWQ